MLEDRPAADTAVYPPTPSVLKLGSHGCKRSFATYDDEDPAERSLFGPADVSTTREY